MKFVIIPPFKAAEAAKTLNPAKTLGIEVTIPALAAKCGLGNIDHHRPGDTSATPSACEQAVMVNVSEFPADTTVVGVAGDADTLTAMAVLKSQTEGTPILQSRVKYIGGIDRLGPAQCGSILTIPYIRGIRAVAASRSTPLEEKIKLVQDLLHPDLPVGPNVKALMEVHQAELNAAYAASEVDDTTYPGIVIVESTHQQALNVGYEYGDVVVALNEKMPKDFNNPEAGTYRKFTIAKRNESVPATIRWDKLAALEPGWAGRTTIGGSPQGQDSNLALAQVASCIEFN